MVMDKHALIAARILVSMFFERTEHHRPVPCDT
jgi:hypothetical protein